MKIPKINWSRLRPTLVLLAMFAIGLTIILYQFTENIVFYFTPAELEHKHISDSQEVRVGGLVKKDSIDIDASRIKFTITDYEKEIEVNYIGILPNLFREDQGVVVKGYIKQGIMYANEILAKHDEKYMPDYVAEKLKEDGKWQQ